MRKLLGQLLILAMLLAGTATAHALSLADIELLTALGILTGEQAELAKEAIGVSSSVGGVGATVRNEEFSTNECLILNENLFLGVSGTAVTALQRFLMNEGHYEYPELTGYYGSVTHTAVADFQIATGLITSRNQVGAGSVGPITREKIQEVSCGSLNTTTQESQSTTETTAPTIQEEATDDFVRRERPSYTPTEQAVVTQVSLQSTLSQWDRYEGTHEFKYEAKIKPDDYVDYFVFTIICDGNNTEVNNRDFGNRCGGSVRKKTSTIGSASIRVEIENPTRQVQTIGMGVEAYDEQDRLLGFDEVLDTLQPLESRPVSYSNTNYQYSGSGGASFTGIEERACSFEEQEDYLKYVMTATLSEANQIPVLPVCQPGNVRCTYDSPPTYCEIIDGPNSKDICARSNEYFYDGQCRDEQVIRDMIS